MTAEMEYLVEEGYVVASMYYRSSAQGHYPDQIIDVKTALRFLRAHADQYEIDPERIGVMGRSAGGHLSAVAGMNTDGWDTENGAAIHPKYRLPMICLDSGYCGVDGAMMKRISGKFRITVENAGGDPCRSAVRRRSVYFKGAGTNG